MASYERYLLDPIAESAINQPLEITGRDAGHGLYLGTIAFPEPELETTRVSNRETEGELAFGEPHHRNRIIPVEVLVAEYQGIVAATNVITNPSFEVDLADWVSAQTSTLNDFSRSAAWAKHSEYSAHGKWTATGAQNGFLASKTATGTNNYPVVVGRTYFLRAHLNVLSKGANGQTLNLKWLDASGNLLSRTTVATVTSLGEQILFGTGVAPASVAFVTVEIGNALTLLANGEISEFYVDDVMLVDQTAAGATITADYIDGDTPGCRWNGQAHRSSSTRYGTGSDGKKFEKSYHDLEQKLEKIMREASGTLRRFLPDGTTETFDLVGARFTGDNWGRPFSQGQQLLTFELEAKPYARLADYSSRLVALDRFQDDTVTNGQWQVDAGGGTIAASAGQLVPSSTVNKILYRRPTNADGRATIKLNSAAIATERTGVLLARLDANNFLLGDWDGTNGTTLRIWKRDGGVYTSLAASAALTLSNSTDYWVRFDKTGNVLTVELFTVDPAANPAAVATSTVTYTLTGADATKFGAGVLGNAGIWITPATTASRYDDFRLEAVNVFASPEPVGTIYTTDVPGSVPALARLRLTDLQALDKTFVVAGVRFRYVDPTFANVASPGGVTGLCLMAQDLGARGGSALATRSAAAGSGANPVMRTAGLTNDWLDVMDTNVSVLDQQQVGLYRVFARVYRGTAAGTLSLRLEWGTNWAAGASRRTQNDPVTLAVGDRVGSWTIVDLGLVKIRGIPVGATSWRGRLLAKASAVGDTVDVNWLGLIPAEEGYVEMRGLQQFETPSLFTARDEFDQTAGALAAKAAPIGGSWATAGSAAGDFQVDATNHQVTRAVGDTTATAISGRFATIAAAAGAQAAQADLKFSTLPTANALLGVIVRWVDASNYLLAVLNYSYSFGYCTIQVIRVIAGNPTVIAESGRLFTTSPPTSPTGPSSFYTLRCVVDGRGFYWVYFDKQGSLSASSLVLTGYEAILLVTLASGKPGIYNANASTGGVAVIDNFRSFAPTADAAIFASQPAEWRYDGYYRQAAGGAWAETTLPEGDPLILPPTRREKRAVQLAVLASRGDPRIGQPDVSSNDDLQASLIVTPRALIVADPS